MTPLLIDAALAAAHVPDAQSRDKVEHAVSQLENLPDYALKFKSALEQDQTLAACLNISNAELENTCEHAWTLFQNGDFLSALPLALYCSTFRTTEPRYAFIAASCLQRLSAPAGAAQLYRTVLQLDETHIAAAYRLGECLLELDDKDSASHLFEWALTLSRRGNFAHREFQDWAMQRLASI
jgi:tetratricopeptide (TPR) repeat protein